MIRENVLDYFQENREEVFRWFRGISSSPRLVDHRLTFRPVKIGSLKLPTGRLVASDPFVFFREKPFGKRVAEGAYEVIVSVAKIEYSHEGVDWRMERVAFAMVKFAETVPVRWELALREGDEAEDRGKLFGYGVDSGTGCFMDLETQTILNDLLQDEEYGFFDFLSRQMEKNYVPAWDWIDYDFEGLPNNNLIAFTSGMGDGRYASYFGLDAHDHPACLVTDFELVKDSEKEETL